MPRSYKSTEVYLKPDPKFASKLASKIINKIMWGGAKTKARKVFYDAMDMVTERVQADPVDIFTKAIENVKSPPPPPYQLPLLPVGASLVTSASSPTSAIR